MKALLELLDQLLYLIEESDTVEGAIAPAHQPEARAVLEGMAREALGLAQAIREELDAREVDAAEAARREELLQQALEAIAHERFSAAERVLEAALDEFPDHHEYYNHLGLVAWERDDMARAERYYARAAELSLSQMTAMDLGWGHAHNRSYLRALEGQALCLYRVGQLDEAVELFETLAQTCVPDYQGCHYLAGEIYHVRGELEEAIARYERSPVEPSVLYNLALAHFQSHALEEAAATFIRAFATNRHICEQLLGRPRARDFDALEGYLASPSYAEEFMDACGGLWDGARDARAFMSRCYEDPLVQRRLVDERGQAPQSPWSGPSREELQRVRGLAQQVLERIIY